MLLLLLIVQLDQVHTQQTTSLSLTNSMPTMEVAMVVHSIEKIVSVRFLTYSYHCCLPTN